MKALISGLVTGLVLGVVIMYTTAPQWAYKDIYPITWSTGEITCEHIPVNEIEWGDNELN